MSRQFAIVDEAPNLIPHPAGGALQMPAPGWPGEPAQGRAQRAGRAGRQSAIDQMDPERDQEAPGKIPRSIDAALREALQLLVCP